MKISDAIVHIHKRRMDGETAESTIQARIQDSRGSMAKDEGLGIAETTRRLSIFPKTIANGVKLEHFNFHFI